MATLSDLSLKNRVYLATYRYRRLDPVPFSVPRRPLSSARVALVSSGAVHLPEQTPFADDIKGGDFSFREIPGDVEVARLPEREAHLFHGFDHGAGEAPVGDGARRGRPSSGRRR